MELMATEVMPRLDRALGGQAPRPRQAASA
jgi:hypothetical protein